MEMDWESEDIPLQIPPTPGFPHTHTVIFLHGRGDNAANFMRGLQSNTWTDSHGRNPMQLFPSFRWVFPTAGQKPCARDGGTSAMSQWFDMWDHQNLRHREELQAPGLRHSCARVRRLVAAEAARLGGRYDKIVLVGISQGGATSVHALLNLYLGGTPSAPRATGPRRLGAFVGVACRMPFPERSLADTRRVLGLDGDGDGDRMRASRGGEDINASEVLQKTPIMLEHCADDPTVLVDSGKQLRDTMERFGAKGVVWREYARGGHWFKSPEGLDDVFAFLSRVLPKQ